MSVAAAAAPSGQTPPTSPVPATSSPLRKTLSDRFVPGTSVFLSKNLYPHPAPRRYRLTTMAKLLEDAVPILGLSAHAQKVFSEDGAVVTSADAVPEQAILVISCGEPFAYGAPSPNALKARYSSPPTTLRTSPPPTQPASPKSPEQPKLTRRQREYRAFQRVVALAPRTSEENMKLAAASLFASLTPEQRTLCKEAVELEKLHAQVQEGLFNALLQRQSITANNIEEGVHAKVRDLFFRVPLAEIKFAIAGPRQSGKTALLHTMASVLNRKLLLSAELARFLLFPLNFELASLILTEPASLLRLFVTVAFDALELSSLRLLPVVDSLRRWFLISIFGSSVPPPSQNGLIDVAPIHALAKRLSTALSANGDHSLEEFLHTLAAFPHEFALAFGFIDAIYIFDSFEFASVQFEPTPSAFPRSLKGANLADCICTEIARSTYIVAMQNEQDFMEAFSCPDAALVDTQRLIEPPQSPVIEVIHPPLQITIDDCLGCPGFIGRFKRLVQDVKRSAENASIAGQFSAVKTVPDISRRKAVKIGLTRLVTLLNGAKNDRFTLELLNEIADTEEVFARTFPDEKDLEEDPYSLARRTGDGLPTGA